jgi:hypothetical protein
MHELELVKQKQGRTFNLFAFVGALFAAVLLLILVSVMIPIIISRAADVQKGKETGPVRIFGLTIIDVSADHCTVQATGKPGETAAIDALSKDLLCLGEANGSYVLYDAKSEQAIFVPTSSVVLDLKNE